MAKLIIIVGLPGSGKSTRVRELRKGSTEGVFVEDFMKGVDKTSPIRRSARFTDSRYYPSLVAALRRGELCVIADIIFCDTLMRIEAQRVLEADVATVDIEWHFFENDPDQCLRNAELRARSSLPRERRLIRFLSAKYFIPEGMKASHVFEPQNARDRNQRLTGASKNTRVRRKASMRLRK